MDRLMALQAFARVVEVGGFTKAGDSLHLSKTTVSDLVQGLEKHLGVRLLQRTTRRGDRHSGRRRLLRALRAHPCGPPRGRTSVMQARVAPKGRTARRICPVGSRGFSSFHDWPPFLRPLSDLRLELGMGLRPVDLMEEASMRRALGVQPDSSLVARTSRYDDFRLLCEPCVPAGAWDPAQSRGAVRPPMRQLCFKSHRTSPRLEFRRATGRRSSSHSMAYCRHDHDPYVVPGLVRCV